MTQELRRRRRLALSCIECRRRKIKCDKKDPCSNCITAKSQCLYAIYGNAPATRKPASRLRSSSSASTSVASRNLLVPPSSTQDTDHDIRDLLERIQKLEQSSASSPANRLPEPSQESRQQQSGLKESRIAFNKTRIIGWSRWVGMSLPEAVRILCHSGPWLC
jgi:hypothetical protein